MIENQFIKVHVVWKSLISFDISVSFEVGVDFFFSFVASMPTANIPNSLAATTHWIDEIINLSLGCLIPLF